MPKSDKKTGAGLVSANKRRGDREKARHKAGVVKKDKEKSKAGSTHKKGKDQSRIKRSK